MALPYILGVLKGDGSVFKRKDKTAVIRLRTISKEFALAFLEALRSIAFSPWLWNKEKTTGGKTVWHVEFHSKDFLAFYKSLSLEDINLLLDTQEKITSFLKGFYDSEGSCSQKQCVFYNSDVELLFLIRRLLKKVGYHPGKVRPNKRCYQLSLSRKAEVLDFLNEIKPSIPHKRW